MRKLRQVGFAAWLRTPAQGFAYHIHAVALSDPDLSSGAQHQAGDYYLGYNSLAGRGSDDGPPSRRSPGRNTSARSRRGRRRNEGLLPPAPLLTTQAREGVLRVR